MTNNSFKKVRQTEDHLYGLRKILLCGYSRDELKHFQKILKEAQLSDIALIAASTESLSQELKVLFSQADKTNFSKDSVIKRTAILAGITEKELHYIMNAYRTSGLPRQFWAALTPVSEKWTLQELLDELKKENEALRKRQLAKN
ncbi:MAG: DUF3783 domain-containing protein [Fidelibacterota bacterium]